MQSTQNQVTDAVVTPAATLQCAALYLDQFGWTQGNYYDQSVEAFTPAACMVGAIGMVCYGYATKQPTACDWFPEFGDFTAALMALEQHVQSLSDEGVYAFNDSRGFTKAQAIRTLYDAAASRFASRGGAR